jgi:hypothetical protein
MKISTPQLFNIYEQIILSQNKYDECVLCFNQHFDKIYIDQFMSGVLDNVLFATKVLTTCFSLSPQLTRLGVKSRKMQL